MPPTIKDFTQAAPQAYAALRDLGQSVEISGLEPSLIELVKLRSSQLNGCTYCLQYHLGVARRLDVPGPKLDQLAAWHDSPLYSPRERAALAWTERLTLLAGKPVAESERAGLREHFSEREALGLSLCIALINAWNRINAAQGTLPPDA